MSAPAVLQLAASVPSKLFASPASTATFSSATDARILAQFATIPRILHKPASDVRMTAELVTQVATALRVTLRLIECYRQCRKDVCRILVTLIIELRYV